MIYLFNDVKELTGTVRNNHILNLLYEREKNGIYSVSAEIPVTYNDQGTIYNYNKKIQKSDFLGHYDKEGRFQLHKIAAVDIENGSIIVKGIHIFFDEAKAGAIIKDRRFVNREIIDGARVAFESIGWSVADFDVSVGKTYNFYNVTPLEARQILVETFGFEFDYWLDFDGKKVTNRHVAVKEKIGEKTSKRYTYGHNVLNIRAEQDYSEIYTAVIGRGKGEEIEETGGYGRRIEYTDVVWSKPSKPLNKPAGTRVLEDPNATQLFGYKENGVVKPRIKVEVFSDIESPTELIQASYDWLMDNNVPKAVFSLKVADGDGLNLGDEVYVIYRDIDLVKSARVEKVIDDLVSGNRDVEFGDTAYFDTDRRLSGLRSDLKRYSGETGDRIYRLKMEANRRFDEIVNGWKDEFDQVQIDIQAQIEADRENMTKLINTKTEEFDANLAAGIADAERKRQENYDAMSNYVNTTVDTTRAELENSINMEITQAKDYAEQQAQEKAETVRTDLETVTSGHQSMIDSLQDNVMNIDDFIGDKTVGLNELLYNERVLFEEKLNNVDTWHYNMLRGTRFDEGKWNATNGEIRTDEDVPYYYFDPNATTSSFPYVQSTQEIVFEQGEVYRLSFDWQTYAVRAVDYVYIIASPDDGGNNVNIGVTSVNNSRIDGTNLFTSWGSEYGRYYIEFSPFRTIRGFIRIGANLNNNEHGRRPFKIRLPYLTTTGNTRWLYHQLDATQNIEEITRRVMQLEDGYEEVITRSEYDFKTGEIEGTIKTVLETVDESSLIIQNHEDWILTNGASIERTVDGFESKAWLTDIHKPNMIPYSRFVVEENIDMWTGRQAPLLSKHGDEWLQIRNTNSVGYLGVDSPNIPDKITSGETYTISWEAFFNIAPNRIDYDFSYMFMKYSNGANQNIGKPRLVRIRPTTVAGVVRDVYIYELTFTANNSDNNSSIIFGTKSETGADIRFFMRYPKLEVGTVSTPYFNAFSNLSQRADEISLAVQGIGEQGFLNQSDIEIVPDYVQIGSQRLDGSNIGSILRVSPTGIDMVAEAMRLSGDLYVDGDITALAVDAIEGNFARLWADEFSAITIDAEMITSGTMSAERIRVNHAFVNRIMAQSVFSNEVTSKIGNFIDLNAGNIVTAGLSANVITSDHIQVGTALIDKFFATSARIDQLITKTHFVNEMHALTLNVVELNASHIRTRLLTANTIEAKWLKSGTALIDRVFASTAMFERMMSKSAFVTTLSAITLDLHELTIWRPDGVAFVQNGMERFGHPVPVVRYLDDEVETDDKTYWTNSRVAQVVGIAYGDHAGRYYNLVVGMGLRWDSDYAIQYCNVQIRTVNSPTGVNIPVFNKEITARRSDGLQWHTLSVPLGRPTYGAMTFQIEIFRRGENVYAPIEMRYGRSWISA